MTKQEYQRSPAGPQGRRLIGPVIGALAVLAEPAMADKRPAGISAVSLPAQRGVAGEVRAVIHAPVERVAQVGGDPAGFRELFPAEEIRVVGQRGDAVLVAVRKREAWPVGELKWVEAVTRRRVGDGFVVLREVVESTFFKHMRAELQVTPLPDAPGNSAVTYRVDVELIRWTPAWMMRRGHLDAMVATVDRLRRMSERAPQPAVSQPAVSQPAVKAPGEAGSLGAVRATPDPSLEPAGAAATRSAAP